MFSFRKKMSWRKRSSKKPIPITGKPGNGPRNTGSCDDLIAIRTKLHLTREASSADFEWRRVLKKKVVRCKQPNQNTGSKAVAFIGFNFCWMWDSCALRNMASSIRFGDVFFWFWMVFHRQWDFVKHKNLALCEPYLVWSFVHWMERCNNSIIYNSRFTICDKILQL